MAAASPSAAIPADDPFTALAAHFGMLLGVSDLETVIGHAWAKMRLHNAWLHGEGVVWGFPLSVDEQRREVRVGAGLALDALGHELSLPATYCLDLAQWYEKNKAGLDVDPGQPFDAHVVARFRACLARPVPALVSPCEGADPETAYSRLSETVELFLLPNKGTRPPDRYPRLRAFLGLPVTAAPDTGTAETVDPDPANGAGTPAWVTDVATARAAVADAPPEQQLEAVLAALRRLAALDGIDRRPSGFGDAGGSALFPGSPPDPGRPEDVETGSLLLGNLIGLQLTQTEPVRATVEEIDYTVRPSHADTATLVELTAPAGVDAGGPRVESGTARLDGDTIRVETTTPVLGVTVAAAATVSQFDATTGWTDLTVASAGSAGLEISLTLDATPPAGAVLRVVLAGTGPHPIVADPGGEIGIPVPLGGIVGGPPAGRHEGHDATFTIGGVAR